MKKVVWDSPYQQVAAAVEIGVTFERGVPQLLPDDQADLLLRKGDDGKPLHPFFKEVPFDAAPVGDKPAEVVKPIIFEGGEH